MMAALKVQAQTPSIRDDSSFQSERLRDLTIEDAHAQPVASKGDMVLFDTEDYEPIAGQLYVTLTDRGWHRVVMCQIIDGYCYAALPNYKKLGTRAVGPMEPHFFQSKILGRVISIYSPMQNRRAA